jgi:3-oxoacyl-(acyl-carrier-protein) synthase
MRRRVAITGCGVVAAAGTELEGFWSALMSGKCFIQPLRRFRVPELANLFGAEVDLPPEDALDPAVDGDAYRARTVELVLAAARRAVRDGGLAGRGEAADRTGVVLGTTLGEERQIGDLSERVARDGEGSIDAGFLERSSIHRLAAAVARLHGLGGPVSVTSSACASGNAALAWAFDLVASGEADAMLAGAGDTLTRSIYCGFHRMGALSKGACRPFDRDRDGVSFGEGAGVVLLEDLARARARGAHVYAELAGYGVSNDAYHVTAPDPNGGGFARALRQALATTGIDPEEVDYVSAHGTGTPYNDVGESRALRSVFGLRAANIPVSAIKSMIGHTNGAAGAIQSIACALSLERQEAPPTAGLVNPDPECGLACVSGKGSSLPIRTCVSMSAGFGGFNTVLLLRRPS